MTKLLGGGVPSLSKVLLKYYTLPLIFMYSYPAYPATIFPAVATTRVHTPTWASPVSIPSYMPTTRGHSTTWASPVSVPEFLLPNPPSPLPLAPTVWRYLQISSSSLPPARFLPGWTKVVSMSPLGSTKLPSCDHPLCNPSTLHTLQIWGVMPPTVPQFTDVSIYSSSPTAFLLPPALPPPWASPTSRLLTAALTSPWYV